MDGGLLAASAALVAVQVARGRSADELALLSAFFSALGDNIAIMAAARSPEAGETDGAPGAQKNG